MKLRGDRNQCQVCKQYFNSSGAFAKHRTGPFHKRRCRTAEEMQAIGMVLPDHGFWIGQRMTNYREISNANAIHDKNGNTDRDHVSVSQAAAVSR